MNSDGLLDPVFVTTWRRRAARWPLALLCVCIAVPAVAQQAGVKIDLVNGNAREERAKEQLTRLLDTYDVARWTFTHEVQIESMAIPHSHPILTLNTRYLDNDDHAISTFLHEQFHWYLIEDAMDAKTDAARQAFIGQFPDAPAGREDGGARDLNSPYLHLIVCDLEFQALTELVGEERARAVLESNTHYTWIYEQVLTNPMVREINERHGIVVLAR